MCPRAGFRRGRGAPGVHQNAQCRTYRSFPSYWRGSFCVGSRRFWTATNYATDAVCVSPIPQYLDCSYNSLQRSAAGSGRRSSVGSLPA